jgi:hypothetical protein
MPESCHFVAPFAVEHIRAQINAQQLTSMRLIDLCGIAARSPI